MNAISLYTESTKDFDAKSQLYRSTFLFRFTDSFNSVIVVKFAGRDLLVAFSARREIFCQALFACCIFCQALFARRFLLGKICLALFCQALFARQKCRAKSKILAMEKGQKTECLASRKSAKGKKVYTAQNSGLILFRVMLDLKQ